MKEKLRLLIFLLPFLYTLYGCSHKYGIAKASSFTQASVAGTIPVGADNQPLTSGISNNYLIFIETTSDLHVPEWKTAWVNNKPYPIMAVKVKSDTLNLGRIRNTQQQVLLTPKKHQQLWQLVLLNNTSTQQEVQEAPKKANEKNIVLTGTWQHQPFTYTLSKIQQLETQFGQ